MPLNPLQKQQAGSLKHTLKQAAKLALLSASAVVGVVAAAYIAEQMPAPVPGDCTPQARPGVHADSMVGNIHLQQPAAHLARPAQWDAAEAPLPPPCAVSPASVAANAAIEARVAALGGLQPVPHVVRCEGCTLVVDRQLREELQRSSSQVVVVGSMLLLAPRVVCEPDGVLESGGGKSD